MRDADTLRDLAHQPRHVGGVAAQILRARFDQADQHLQRLEVGDRRSGYPADRRCDLLGRERPLLWRVASERNGHRFLADQVALEHVHHVGELLVRAAVEASEGVDVAAVGLGDGGLDRQWPPDERLHLLHASRQLRSGAAHWYRPGRRPRRLAWSAGSNITGKAVHCSASFFGTFSSVARSISRLGELLGRDEAGAVGVGQELEQLELTQHTQVEDGLLDPPSE